MRLYYNLGSISCNLTNNSTRSRYRWHNEDRESRWDAHDCWLAVPSDAAMRCIEPAVVLEAEDHGILCFLGLSPPKMLRPWHLLHHSDACSASPSHRRICNSISKYRHNWLFNPIYLTFLKSSMAENIYETCGHKKKKHVNWDSHIAFSMALQRCFSEKAYFSIFVSSQRTLCG